MDFFDRVTGVLRLDEVVAEQETFKKILADSQVSDAEVAAQSARVVALLKQVEAQLNAEARDLVGTAIAELCVLYAAIQYQQLRQFDLGAMTERGGGF